MVRSTTGWPERLRRVGFIDHHLWVTPYRPNERYAAGDYPTLSKPGYGLPAWTRENRSIELTDIVLWHTIGMHHMVRAEDWPVMPVLWHSFALRPFDFFDGNPALVEISYDMPMAPSGYILRGLPGKPFLLNVIPDRYAGMTLLGTSAEVSV